MFTAYEKDLPLVHERKVVRVRVESLPGEPIHARVCFISPNLDEATRSPHVRVVLENPGRRLKNKSFAEGTIELDAPEVLAIPHSAILWPGGTPRVFVRRAPDAYERREVKLHRSGDAPPSVAGTFQSRRYHRSAMIQSHNLNTRPPHTSCLSSSPLISSARATLP